MKKILISDDQIMSANADGMNAWDEGKSVHDNPYRPLSLRNAWHEGFVSAERLGAAKLRWRDLRNQADRGDYDPAREALDYAEANADDTVYVEKAAPESDWHRIALDSISLTSVFTDNEQVRWWFEARGYRG